MCIYIYMCIHLLFWSYSEIIIYITGEVEETNGININMDSLEFDSNLLKINSEDLYNFDIENMSENLSNILSISDITKVYISYLYFLINLLNE